MKQLITNPQTKKTTVKIPIIEFIMNSTNATSGFTQLRKIFYHNDHLGSTSVITYENGSIVEETFYDPYGNILSGGNVSRYAYEGKEYSQFTEDYDFNFRKYNPEIGVFTQPDAVVPNVYDPQSLNRYRFERNNPYKYVDKDGKIPVIAIPAIVYIIAETSIDLSSLYISFNDFKQDQSIVNGIALGADILDTSTPISFPGPSGRVVKGIEKLFEKEIATDIIEEGVLDIASNIESNFKNNKNGNRLTSNSGVSKISSNNLGNSNINIRNSMSNKLSSKSIQLQSSQRSLSGNNNKLFSSSPINSNKHVSKNNKNSWWKNLWSKTQNKFLNNKKR